MLFDNPISEENERASFGDNFYSLCISCTNKKHEHISKHTGQLPSLHGLI